MRHFGSGPIFPKLASGLAGSRIRGHADDEAAKYAQRAVGSSEQFSSTVMEDVRYLKAQGLQLLLDGVYVNALSKFQLASEQLIRRRTDALVCVPSPPPPPTADFYTLPSTPC